MKSFSFSKNCKIKSRNLFDLIFEKGEKDASGIFVLWHLNSFDFPDLKDKAKVKLGIIVSKKNGGAVERNRLKRYLRESFRKNKNTLKEGSRIVVYPKPGRKIESFHKADAEFMKVLGKAGLTD